MLSTYDSDEQCFDVEPYIVCRLRYRGSQHHTSQARRAGLDPTSVLNAQQSPSTPQVSWSMDWRCGPENADRR